MSIGVVDVLLMALAILHVLQVGVVADDVFADNEANGVASVEVWALLGLSTELPCDVGAVDADDQLLLVLWYKRGQGPSPIYTLDHRAPSAKHYVDRSVWGHQRARLVVSNSSVSVLRVARVGHEDDGLYRCRVDFRRSPTRNTNVRLHVVVPARAPLLLDQDGRRLQDEVGPLHVGQSLEVLCVDNGGSPSPTLSWYRNGVRMAVEDNADNAANVANADNVNNVEEERKRWTTRLMGGEQRKSDKLLLLVDKVAMEDDEVMLECQATNNNDTKPAISSLRILLALPPSKLTLVAVNTSVRSGPRSEIYASLSAGRAHNLRCEAPGSRPAPTFVWLLDGRPLLSSRSSVSTSLSSSTLTLRAEADDDGKSVSCVASTPFFPDINIQRSLHLRVTYVPIAHLSFGAGLVPTSIKEGDDVYFECDVRAKPAVDSIAWRHNGHRVQEKVSEGVLLGNHTLVLQSVNLKKAGLYTCVASNQEGDSESNAQLLDILYAPRCRPGQRHHYGLGLKDSSEVRCYVDSNPRPKSFKWAIVKQEQKSTRTHIVDKREFSINADHSVLRYKADRLSDLDVSVSCWATNWVGEQRDACQFKVVHETKPQVPRDCQVASLTSQTVRVLCNGGFDGGHEVQFHAEVWHSMSWVLLSNITRSEADFLVQNLASNTSYTLRITSSNIMGSSEESVLVNVTTKNEKAAEVAAAAVGPVADEQQYEEDLKKNNEDDIPKSNTDLVFSINTNEDKLQRQWALLPILIILLAVALGLCSVAIVVTFMARGRGRDGSREEEMIDNELFEMESKAKKEHYLLNMHNPKARSKAVHFNDDPHDFTNSISERRRMTETSFVSSLPMDPNLTTVLPPANFSDSPPPEPATPLLTDDHGHRPHRSDSIENAFVTFCPETLESRRSRLDVINATRL